MFFLTYNSLQNLIYDTSNSYATIVGFSTNASWFYWQAKVMVAEQTEQDIDATRLEYVPVAVRTQILFFCVSDLSNVDPMYQYSLEWFLGIFMAGIANSERAGKKKFHIKFYHAMLYRIMPVQMEKSLKPDVNLFFLFLDMCLTESVEKRIGNINEFFTFSLYSNVCRSLFEKHKLMFAFLLCARIMMNDNKIDMVSNRGVCSLSLPSLISSRSSYTAEVELIQVQLMNLCCLSVAG